MRHASIVLAHSQPEQLSRLVHRLCHRDDLILVHIDARQPLAPFVQALAPHVEAGHAEFVRRVPCRWGGWGLVEAALIGVRAALDGGADRVSLLSGTDYPVTSRAVRMERLAGDAAFLETVPLPSPTLPDGGGMDRLERFYVRPGRRWSLPNRFVPWWPKRTLPDGLVPFGGNQFWSLPADVLRDLLAQLDARPELVRFWRRSFVADETFIQTLVMNGPHAERVVDDDLRFISHAPFEAHPRLLGVADFDAIAASGDLFARKFAQDDPVLDQIDASLLEA